MPSSVPVVWYVTQGYARAGGVEVYLLHYATEMRRRGFDSRVVVLDPLPEHSHWCLDRLRERAIPVVSVSDASRRRRRLATLALRAPWTARNMLAGRGRGSAHAFARWVEKRVAVRTLEEMIARDKPDLLHVKGRLIAEAWPVFPVERTIYHVATGGQRDESWEEGEVAAFRAFAQRTARVFAPGSQVAKTLQRDFALDRPVKVVFTMAPDEAGGSGFRCQVSGVRKTEDRRQETGDRRQETGDSSQKPEVEKTANREPRTKNREPGAAAVIRFGFLGRLHEEKGLRELMQALVLLQQEGVHVPFLFAGEGPMEEEIREFVDSMVRIGPSDSSRSAPRQLADSESSNPRILESPNPRISGPPNSRIRLERVAHPVKSLARMDVLVLPSRSEAMPVAIVEAFMCGCPCIATAVGGVTDLVRDGVEGLLIGDAAPATIAAATKRFIAMSATEFAGYRVRARSRYEQCCRPEVVGSVVEAEYRSVMGEAGTR